MAQHKYIFVTGGVCSSLGKGIAASTIAALVEAAGYRTAMGKIDPYLNLDAGTMSPIQHGETYVTVDGAETDLDLGNYERFTRRPMHKKNSITTGQVYQSVITRERRGDYLGKCVQVIPHITDEIKERILSIGSEDSDITIIEIGGTVGDIEATPFLEAARQLITDVGAQHFCFVHLTLIPSLPGSKELKTKPTQHSVQKLRELGIQPDILLCRMDTEMPSDLRCKIALFTQVPEAAIIEATNFCYSPYELPIIYHRRGLTQAICKSLDLSSSQQDLSAWEALYQRLHHPKQEVHIAIVGKYTSLHDSYKSVIEALGHAALHHEAKAILHFVDSETITPDNLHTTFQNIHAILIPGGFGTRGTEGMILATQYARTHQIPYFGICLGLHVMVTEYARHVAMLAGANSTELDPQTPHPVISLLENQKKITTKGGTMRLGSQEAILQPGGLLAKAYGTTTIHERHRHRYEFNNAYKKRLEAHHLVLEAYHPEKGLVEAISWPDHPWGVSVQYHPELQSNPFEPHPLFVDFIHATLQCTSSQDTHQG